MNNLMNTIQELMIFSQERSLDFDIRTRKEEVVFVFSKQEYRLALHHSKKQINDVVYIEGFIENIKHRVKRALEV